MHIHPTVSELVPTMLSDLRPMDEPRLGQVGTRGLKKGVSDADRVIE